MNLPIETIREPLLDALRTGRHFVLQAEPGAGKTTRVPVMLHESGLTEGRDILVAQPRRIAARMAALRVASTLGEPVGQTCGYQVRFDSKVSAKTRIRFVTEGLLLRRLRDDPSLDGVSTVILDEFHERHIHTDVALALLHRLAKRRDDLRIGVMSATLAPEPIAAFLRCRPLHCEGRTFPVEVRHALKASERPLPGQVSVALRELASEGADGSVLVFLPGAREIRACAKHLAGQAAHLGLELVQLHGDLSATEQDRAVAAGQRPKLILSTNVAETSVTIDHVVAVIDSGLSRKPSHNPWTGIPTLSLAKISRASAEQRAGRAGRVRAGRCVRLFSKHDFDRRPAFDAPELCRLDLASAMLDLRAAGLRGPADVEWFEAPPEAAVHAAETLLARLGAVDTAGNLTAAGRSMLQHPVHPRLARVLEEAKARNVAALGTTAVALLSERSIRRRDARSNSQTAASDVVVEAEHLRMFERDGASAAHRLGLDIGACKMVLRVRAQLRKALGVRGSSGRATPADEDALGLALLAGFPDRIGRLREAASGGLELVFAEGGSAALDERSAVRDTDLAVALAVEERKGPRGQPTVLIRSAAAVELEGLLELFVDDLEEHRVVTFDSDRERVTAVEEVRLGALVVETNALRDIPPEAADVLFEAARARGIEAFIEDRDAAKALESRTRFAHRHAPEVPVLDEARMLEVLRAACERRTSFGQIRKAGLLGLALGTLPHDQRAALERFAPSHVTLGGGRRLRVHYELDRDPWVESRLQDFFGASTGPTVADGRTPLVLHLLAPNMRAVQVTTDLAGFWERHYPDQRKALMRRYPKHDWPEKPLEAKPPAPRPRRRRRK
ncbi:MAG: ATP-dependent helicase HrpB [Nannocystaceae bacterium]|nr:ATP-dependent helicase HrpB [bacterium]